MVYELYLHQAEGPGAVRIETCSPDELPRRAQALLEALGAERAEICQDGRHLFTVTHERAR